MPEWRALIARGVKNVIDRQLDEFDIENRENARAWVEHIQGHLRRRAAATLAMEGYVVTTMLLRKLAEEVQAVEIEMEQEAGRMTAPRRQRRAGGRGGAAPRRRRRAPREPSRRSARPSSRGVAAIHYRSEARLRHLVVALLPDLARNVITPLAEEIDRAGQALRGRAQPAAGAALPGQRLARRRRGAQPAAPRGQRVPARADGVLRRRPCATWSRAPSKQEDETGAFRAIVQRIIVGAEDVDDARPGRRRRSPRPGCRSAHELHAELSTPQRASYDVGITAEDPGSAPRRG